MKKIIFAISTVALIIYFSIVFIDGYNEKKKSQLDKIDSTDQTYSTNIIENVEYSSKDSNGNLYKINAKEGEIDINNSKIIFLKNVNAIVKLNNSNEILVSSNFGKYNIANFDTIFSENVIINYLQNTINGEYMDFSILRNSMIISKNVIYTNDIDVIKTDVVEVNIKTKDTKFYMQEEDRKVLFERNN